MNPTDVTRPGFSDQARFVDMFKGHAGDFHQMRLEHLLMVRIRQRFGFGRILAFNAERLHDARACPQEFSCYLRFASS